MSGTSTHLGVILAVVLCAGAARADDDVVDRAPRVVEVAHIDVAGEPFGMSYWAGAHGWLYGRHYLAARIGAKKTFIQRDLDGDGEPDFSGKDSGTHIEAQLDVAWPLRVERAVVGHDLVSRVRRVIDGREVLEDRYDARIARVTTLSLVGGARVALGGDPVQVGVPLGVRWDRHRRTRDVRQYAERWAQLRVIGFPQAPGVGFDAEVGWLPHAFGIAGFVEYVPAHHDVGPGEFSCQPVDMTCSPDHPITAFDLVPYESRFTFGIRLVGHLPR